MQNNHLALVDTCEGEKQKPEYQSFGLYWYIRDSSLQRSMNV